MATMLMVPHPVVDRVVAPSRVASGKKSGPANGEPRLSMLFEAVAQNFSLATTADFSATLSVPLRMAVL